MTETLEVVTKVERVEETVEVEVETVELSEIADQVTEELAELRSILQSPEFRSSRSEERQRILNGVDERYHRIEDVAVSVAAELRKDPHNQELRKTSRSINTGLLENRKVHTGRAYHVYAIEEAHEFDVAKLDQIAKDGGSFIVLGNSVTEWKKEVDVHGYTLRPVPMAHFTRFMRVVLRSTDKSKKNLISTGRILNIMHVFGTDYTTAGKIHKQISNIRYAGEIEILIYAKENASHPAWDTICKFDDRVPFREISAFVSSWRVPVPSFSMTRLVSVGKIVSKLKNLDLV